MKWNLKTLSEEVSKYEYIADFGKYSHGAYIACTKRNLLQTLCKHLKRKHHNYWTLEDIKKEALKYSFRRDFQFGSPKAYDAAIRHKCIDIVCSHMGSKCNILLKDIYVFEFSNKTAYIGLSCNVARRFLGHRVGGPVCNLLHSGIPYEFKILYSKLPIFKAKDVEKEEIAKYSKEGWILLNKSKGGELGSPIRYWTLDRIMEEVKKYKTKKELREGSPKCWSAIKKHKLMSIVCSNMPKRTIKYDLDTLSKIAFNYNSRYSFQKNQKSAYNAAVKYSHLDFVCQHMIRRTNPCQFSSQK